MSKEGNQSHKEKEGGTCFRTLDPQMLLFKGILYFCFNCITRKININKARCASHVNSGGVVHNFIYSPKFKIKIQKSEQSRNHVVHSTRFVQVVQPGSTSVESSIWQTENPLKQKEKIRSEFKRPPFSNDVVLGNRTIPGK